MKDDSEQDLELLEAYLDDALSKWESDHVTQRLASDAGFAAMLQSLRHDRDARRAVWSAMESAHGSSADSFSEMVFRRARSADRWRTLRYYSSFAAAAAIFFLAGWIGHGIVRATLGTSDATHAVAQGGSNIGPSTTRLVGATAEPGSFQVVLTDDAGNVLAIQKFSQLDEARQFANDLSRFRTQQQNVRQGQMVLISDEF